MIGCGMILFLALVPIGGESVPQGASDRIPLPGRLVDLNNRAIVDPSNKATKAICLIFLGAECPVSNALSPEIARIQKAYAPRGVVFGGVYPDPDVNATRAREHAREYSLELPQILDPKLELARLVRIELTPEAVVLDPSGKVLWRGRINDQWTLDGKKRLAPQTHDLKVALNAILEGKSAPPAGGKGYGCPLPEVNVPKGGSR